MTLSGSVCKSGKGFEICVSDTGIGISPTERKKLFKKFSQIDNYLQKKEEGTGLGLSICKKIMEDMDGKIRIKESKK